MNHSVFHQYRWYFLAVICSVLLLIFGYSLARTNLSLQIKAFQNQLDKAEVNDRSVSHSRLIIKYIKQKEFYSGQIDRNRLDSEEFRYNRKILPVETKRKDPVTLSVNETIVLAMFNTYRFLTGYKPILAGGKKDVFHEIIKAYYLEKKQEYNAAIAIYDKSLSLQQDFVTRGNLILHKAYCYAMMEEDDAARTNYKVIISSYPGTDLSVAASILLMYMEMFEQERARILKSSTSSLVKGEKLSILLSHKAALKVMENFESKDVDEVARLNFTKGICFEALGEKEKAINSYLTSIKIGSNTKSARYANRRMYTIASDIPKNNTILLTCRKIAEKQKDKILLEIDNKYRDEITSSLKDDSGNEGPITSEQIFQAIKLSEILTKDDSATIAVNITPEGTLKIDVVNEIVSSMQGKEIRVETISNEIFIGTLINSEKEAFILMDSPIGQFKIRKDRIKAMDQVSN